MCCIATVSTLRSLPAFAVSWHSWPDDHQLKWELVTPTPRIGRCVQVKQIWCRVRPKNLFSFATLQGSHPVPQPAAERVARHLQVGLEGSQKVDVLLCLFVFFRLPSWNFQDLNITESCAVPACRTVRWLPGPNSVNERSWRPGRAFNFSGLVTGDLKNAMLACWLWVGYGWNMLEKGLCLGQSCFDIRCSVFDLSCWRHALFDSGNSEVSVAFFRSLSGIATIWPFLNT